FSNVGMRLPRTAREQYQKGTAVATENLTPGDLLFFSALKSFRPTHVALYLGNGLILHASRQARKVVIDSFEKSSYLRRQFVGARRLIETEDGGEDTVTP
ncbi:MAG TPA: C40 family peptidase, partial [bacterium]|nr:C40 family peptidase [bacterium]